MTYQDYRTTCVCVAPLSARGQHVYTCVINGFSTPESTPPPESLRPESTPGVAQEVRGTLKWGVKLLYT